MSTRSSRLASLVLTLLGATSLLLVANGCSDDVAGCQSDSACRGDRICVQQTCMTPDEAAAVGASGDEDSGAGTGGAEPADVGAEVEPPEAGDEVECPEGCASGSLCDDGVCRPECFEDVECPDGEICRPRREGEGHVCNVGVRCNPGGGANSDTSCSSSLACADGGDYGLRCSGDDRFDPTWECACLQGGEVVFEFTWDRTICLHGVGPSVALEYCGWEHLYGP